MPPASAVPPLRTLRRVTVVMHSSLGDGDALRPVWRRLGVGFRLSRLRGATRTRALACATRCFDNHLQVLHLLVLRLLVLPAFRLGDSGATPIPARNTGGSPCRHVQPAHEPYRHTGSL